MTDVIGIDHIYITVTDLQRSESFYDRVLKDTLGFRKNTFVLGSDAHIQYFNRHFGYVLRPSRSSQAHDPYSPGLHHFCFRVDSIADVVSVANQLRASGIEASEAAHFPDYAPDYWATFFNDPDGVRLEVTNYRQERRDRHDNWNTLGQAAAGNGESMEPTVPAPGRQPILVSACLLGEPVRYNGTGMRCDDAILRRWLDEGRVVPFCPEVAGGLPVPRLSAEISTGAGGAKVLAGEHRVLATDGQDFTPQFVAGAHLALAEAQRRNIRVAILKEGSPSCGSGQIYDGTFSGQRIPGSGVTAALLRSAGIAVFSEEQLADASALLMRLETGTAD